MFLKYLNRKPKNYIKDALPAASLIFLLCLLIVHNIVNILEYARKGLKLNGTAIMVRIFLRLIIHLLF